VKQEVLCYSLSGIEVPMLTVTSRANLESAELIEVAEFAKPKEDKKLSQSKDQQN